MRRLQCQAFSLTCCSGYCGSDRRQRSWRDFEGTQPGHRRKHDCGAIGGGVGGQLLTALIPALAQAGSSVDIGALIGQFAGGGIAGAILTAIVALVKNRMAA